MKSTSLKSGKSHLIGWWKLYCLVEMQRPMPSPEKLYWRRWDCFAKLCQMSTERSPKETWDIEPLRKLFGLLGQTSFYIRFSSLQLLSQIVQNRAQAVQKHLIDYPDGLPAVIAILDEKREVIRNEALLLLQSLAHQNADIQKILAFSGAFEKLLDIVAAEGGVEGGVVVQDCLAVVDAMLRFNSSNQNYFRELSLPPRIPPLLLYPSPPPPLNVPAPQEFALQFWDAQKLANAGMLVGIISLLTGSKTKSVEPSLRPLEAAGIFRCLIELGLSSNAPAPLKTQALLALPSRPNLTVHITPYLPVPGSNGEEWDRLPEQEALGALVGVALDGEYGGVLAATEDDVDVGLGKEELELRWAAASVFDNLISNDQTARLALAASLAPPPPPPPRDPAQPMVPLDPPTPGQHLLSALVDFPASGRIGRRVATKIQLACALLSSLVRGSEKAKGVARMVVPGENKPVAGADADADSDDSPRLVSVLIGNVHLALRERGQNNRRAWDRVIVSLLMVLSNWMWDSPSSVRDFFGEGGGLQVVGLPITQTIGMDVLVQGLCAFLLGVCYEFNREPGEITRFVTSPCFPDKATLYPILHSRIGADVFIARMARVREDERFKAVGPDSPVIPAGLGLEDEPQPEEDGEVVGGDVWLDWGFVEFWKGNGWAVYWEDLVAMNEETAELIRSLKETIRAQAGELESLTEQLGKLTKERDDTGGRGRKGEEAARGRGMMYMYLVWGCTDRGNRERRTHPNLNKCGKNAKKRCVLPEFKLNICRESHASQIAALTEKVAETTTELDKVRAQKADSEKEQEDLLVFLEELSSKRKKDKARMKEKGMDVSEDEDRKVMNRTGRVMWADRRPKESKHAYGGSGNEALASLDLGLIELNIKIGGNLCSDGSADGVVSATAPCPWSELHHRRVKCNLLTLAGLYILALAVAAAVLKYPLVEQGVPTVFG
ncbi:transporter [Rhizoctonia solani AG-1 IA]|uniref:Transporter n=1 Tax=Thanatephorus cucumeris (strain AG1-IA) TaxID=983506 RepID=L8WYV9_THACA|nr:transporter [Rhizoctonia solani AG-1 IA]